MSRLLQRTLPLYRKVVPLQFRQKIAPTLWRVGTIPMKLTKSVPITGGKYVVFINPRDPWGLELFTDYYRHDQWFDHEPFGRAQFLQCVEHNPGTVVVDIGASYGFFTLDTCHKLGVDQVETVIAIEPDRDTAGCLARSIKANGYEQQVMLVNAAAVDVHDSDCPFYRHTKISAWNKLVNESAAYHCEYNVRGVTLDDLLIENNISLANRFVIKVDIEGGEPRALKGMEKTLQTASGYIVVSEFHPPAMKLSGHDPHAFGEAILKLDNDAVFEIDELGQRIAPIRTMDDIDRLIERCMNAPVWYMEFRNILFTRDMNLPNQFSIPKYGSYLVPNDIDKLDPCNP
jgi:FkbM family methyltransferase